MPSATRRVSSAARADEAMGSRFTMASGSQRSADVEPSAAGLALAPVFGRVTTNFHGGLASNPVIVAHRVWRGDCWQAWPFRPGLGAHLKNSSLGQILLVLTLVGCQCLDPVTDCVNGGCPDGAVESNDAGPLGGDDGGADAGSKDGGLDSELDGGFDAGADVDAGTCDELAWRWGTNDPEPSWVTGSCPAGGCPSGTTCVHGAVAAALLSLGCAPVPPSCTGEPTCGCMGCICGSTQCIGVHPAGYSFECDTQTESRRSAKTDISYVDDAARDALARQTLTVRLARYRYKNEAPEARRRLGFIIDDQPDPSPAVLADREHVDEYGYTSMLLATVQQQARELEALRRRVEALERRR